jgi:hypothetical protein
MQTTSPVKGRNLRRDADGEDGVNPDLAATPRAHTDHLFDQSIPLLAPQAASTESSAPSSPSRGSRIMSKASSSARSTSLKKVSLNSIGNGVWDLQLDTKPSDVRAQLGPAGEGLWQALGQALVKVEYGTSVVPPKVRGRLTELVGWTEAHWFDKNDERPVKELLAELDIIQAINNNSNRCSSEHDHECEWNNCVYILLLELALG